MVLTGAFEHRLNTSPESQYEPMRFMCVAQVLGRVAIVLRRAAMVLRDAAQMLGRTAQVLCRAQRAADKVRKKKRRAFLSPDSKA
jgi:hypothetical protein